MRIGILVRKDVSNNYYRALGPGQALLEAGHEVELAEQQADGSFDASGLLTCDVVHIYRRAGAPILACIDELHRRGIGVTWDNDDDVRRVPPETGALYKQTRGLSGVRDFQGQVQVMRRADVVTTPSLELLRLYEEAGAKEVMHVENHLLPAQFSTGRDRHEGLVIGWVAAGEHRADVTNLGINDLLQRLMDRHPEVRVVTLGVRLQLDPARYTHVDLVPFVSLSEHIRGFDIGIAPVSDIPMTHTRSNVKVKEYAAAGVPWLASDRGPYRGLGAEHGGRLVPDDAWERTLEELITSRFTRWKLRRRATAWGKSQAIERHTDRWLEAFERAIERANARGATSRIAASASR